MAQQVGVGMTKATRLLFWTSMVCLVCLAIALAICLTRLVSGSIGMRGFVRNLLPYTGIWVGPYMLWIGTYNARFKRISRIMLEHLRCPHCGYDIRGLRPDPSDGALVCPECGCAWKSPDAPTRAA
jgi:hypothetical protein